MFDQKSIRLVFCRFEFLTFFSQKAKGWGGVPEVPSNYLYTLLICICILIYIVKSCPHKSLVGFKFWSRWGTEYKKSKKPYRLDFFEIVLKVKKNTEDFPVKWNQIKFERNSLVNFLRGPINLLRIFHVNLKAISIFG